MMKRNKLLVFLQVFIIAIVPCIGHMALMEELQGAQDASSSRIDFQIKKWAEWIVEIKDNNGNLKRIFNGSSKVNSSDIELYWDGKDEDGKMVKDGIYNYTIKQYWDAAAPVTALTAIGDVIEIDGKLYSSPKTEYILKASDSGRPKSGVKTIYYSINDNGWSKYSVPIKLDKEGLYTISYRAEDVAGNMEKDKVVSIIVDDSPPDIIVTGPDDKSYYNHEVTIGVDIEDGSPLAMSSIVIGEKIIKSGEVVSEDGNYKLVINVKDVLNNYANRSIVFGIDRESPNVNISGVCDNAKCSEVNPVIDVSDKNLLKVEIFLNNELVQASDEISENYKFEMDKIEDNNDYVLTVKAVDKANNITKQAVEFSIENDNSLLFSANYDKSGNADYSAGSGKALYGGVITGDGEGKNGEGKALSADGKGVVYEAKDNIDKAKGTLMMWVKPEWEKINNNGNYFFSLNNKCKEINDMNNEFAINFVLFENRGIVVQMKDEDDKRSIIEQYLKEANKWYESGEWTHLAFSWDSSLGEIRIYINGKEMDVKEELSAWKTKNMSCIWVGNQHNDESKNSESKIDDFKVYNKMLTAEEVKEIMSN